MAVDPVLKLLSTGVLPSQLVEKHLERLFPHPVDVATNRNGFIYMLDFHESNRKSRLVALQLHNPVCCKVLMTELEESQSLCLHNDVAFLASSQGLVFYDPHKKLISKIPQRKQDLVKKLAEFECNTKDANTVDSEMNRTLFIRSMLK